jgi:hypothetical protein
MEYDDTDRKIVNLLRSATMEKKLEILKLLISCATPPEQSSSFQGLREQHAS